MPSPASTKKVATKKASSSNKVARKKAPKPKKPAAKPKPKTAKKPAAKKASAKKTKTAVKKAGTTKPKARKAKHAPKAKATKAASKAEVATVAKAQSSAAEPASLLDEFYAAHPHLRMPVVFFTFSEDPLDEDNRYASKVGGHPFWPASKAWDKSTMGSLRLFMQINFADVPSDHGIAGMPTDGIFQIFWNNYEAASSADADDDAVQGPDTFVIRFWPVEDVSAAASDGKLLSTENLPSLEGDNSMMGVDPTTPHGIEFKAATKMFVTRSDYRFQAAFSKWARERNLDSEVAHYVYSEAHHRDGDADHGLLGGSPHSFNGDFRQLDAAEPYELLLQIKSEGPLMCGDCGLESFFIRPTRLAARDFSQVQYVHDE